MVLAKPENHFPTNAIHLEITAFNKLIPNNLRTTNGIKYTHKQWQQASSVQ